MVNANGKLTAGFYHSSSKTKYRRASQWVQKFWKKCRNWKGSNKTSIFVLVVRVKRTLYQSSKIWCEISHSYYFSRTLIFFCLVTAEMIINKLKLVRKIKPCAICQVSAVQRLDGAIYWINCYPLAFIRYTRYFRRFICMKLLDFLEARGSHLWIFLSPFGYM